MSAGERHVDRRTVLQGAGAGLAAFGVGTATADPVSETVDDAVKAAPSVFGEVGRRINELRYPLVGVPAVQETGETLRVELDVDDVPDDVTATLTPSFGAATPETELPLAGVAAESSIIWGDAVHAVAEFEIPGLTRTLTEGLYDLRVEFDGTVDGQPRAVSVHDAFPDAPDVAVMGDPHVGDPRPFQDGARESFEEREPDPFLFRYRETLGTGTEEDRWGAFRTANSEVNAEAPDVVIVIGDLAFGSADYYQEYEDAYRVLNRIDAPTFVTLGNHDGYITPGAGIDGKKLWHRYFAPWHYSVDIRPNLHFVSIDSYDWPAMDRIAPSAIPSTWGGQVRDPQFDWLAADLRSWRDANPDGTIVTLSHHNPSWKPTEQGEATRTTDGVPGAEQAARGAEGSGGGWLGKNRLAVRTLLEDVGVSLHLSGHAHRDRLARVDGDGTVAATTGTGLEYVDQEGEPVDGDPRSVLLDGDGPLYVEATTAASGTTEYWGWRVVPLSLDRRLDESDRVDPETMGYPATNEFLDDRALEPALWRETNADLGLYSTPSYLLNAEVGRASRECTTIDVRSDLARSFDGAVTLPLGDCEPITVEGGEVEWRRRGEEWQDVRVSFDLEPGEDRRISIRCDTPGG